MGSFQVSGTVRGRRRASAQDRAALGPPIQRIVCISDTHGLHRKVAVPEGDLLIHAGDFMSAGKSLEEIADFNDWLGGQPHPHKIVVAGNHDLLFEKAPDKARAQLTNAAYLENEGIVLGGVTFWGSPNTPVFPNWAFHVERGAASRRYWDRIPLGTDVVITHGPPYGTLDKRHILGSRFGCKDLIQAVLRVKPKLHVFGHVHGSYGQEVGPNGTRMVNCAVLDEEYVLTNAPIVVSL
jgi:Icc-related predicted phosphoesterase